jgi:hypothetical protein
MRTANLLEIGPDRTASTSPRKYLSFRRTSRRAYNLHMSRMRDTWDEINPMPAFAIFGSLVGIAFLLSVVIH